MENEGYLQNFNPGETFNNVSGNISNTASNAYNSVKDSVNSFASTDYVNAGKDFLKSNSLIAKFVFIILVVIVFVFLFNLGIFLITYFLEGNRNPYLINGMINGNQYIRTQFFDISSEFSELFAVGKISAEQDDATS